MKCVRIFGNAGHAEGTSTPMFNKLLSKLNHKDSKHRVAIRKMIAKHKSKKLHRDILTGKAPRGRT